MKSKIVDIEGIGKGLMIKLERDGGKDLIEQLKAAVALLWKLKLNRKKNVTVNVLMTI